MRINQYGGVTNNPYQKQLNQQAAAKQNQTAKQDQIEISSEALKLQKGNEIASARQEKVDAIKSQVASGTYQINHEKVAEKFIEYWTK